MQNPPPPNVSNPGEMPVSHYGGHQQGQSSQSNNAPPQAGMPYPYVVFPMGAPMMYMPAHPDMVSHTAGEMPVDPHLRGPMMPMPYGAPYQHIPHHVMHPQMQMNPNVPQFVPSAQHQRRDQAPSFSQSGPVPSLQPQRTMTTSSDVSVSDRRVGLGGSPTEAASAAPVSKPVSRRLPIIDPVTGEEISIKPVTASAVPTAPASALVNADVAFGTVSGTPTPKIVSRTTSDVSGTAQPPPEPVVEETDTPATSGKPKPMKIKNAPLLKPKPSDSGAALQTDVSDQMSQTPPLVKSSLVKPLNRIRNIPLKIAEQVITPPLETGGLSKSKFRLTNKSLSAPVVRPIAVAVVTVWPISRDIFLKYLPASRPDRNAPSSVNVFPSELLGLRTAPYGDPGLSRVSGGRRGGVGLQKTMSAVSTGSRGGNVDSSWRSNKLGRTLSRQSSRGGKMGIVRPSERGFKIVDQSSLSEKDKLRRQVMSLLNKLTVDSFGQITTQISEIEITQPWQMDVVIGLIFDKAIVEHKFSEMYAEMCRKLRNTWPELIGVDSETGQAVPVTFTRAIIEKCQVEFDAIPDTLEATEAEIARARGDPQDLELFMMKKKERILGNMKFIAQLFLNRILSSRVVRSVVEQLLFRRDEPEEHYIECVGILLHNIGSTLYETDSGRAYISQFVDRMRDLCARQNYGKRIKFLMKDVIEAAEAGWSGKYAKSHLVATAKSKEAVRRDAQQEQVTPSRDQQRGASDRRPQPPAGGWTTKQTSNSSFKPTGVLNRNSGSSAQLERKESIQEEEEEWEDEEESEYAPSSHDEESSE